MKEKQSHFKGFSVLEHLKKAREKGQKACGEFHATEAPGHISAAADSAKDTAIATIFLFILATHFKISSTIISPLIFTFLIGMVFWKTARSFSLGWTRLDRIDRLVKEEKYEIENNREEEREELTEMYKAKGFSQPLLSQIIDVLMSDDNKLLQVMLEEELGVKVNTYVHPLKQCLGAALGVVITAICSIIALIISPSYGLYISTFILIFIAAFVIAKIERLKILEHVVNTLSITFLSVFATFFISKYIATYLH